MSALAYWEAELAAGRFVVQCDRQTGEAIFPPRIRPDESFDWQPVSGGGTVYSVTVVHPRPPELPYNVALIDLDEGVRVMSRVEGIAPEEVRIGMRVTARIGQNENGPVLLFNPA